MVKLVISDNEGTTTIVPLVRDEISIGRKDGNTIRLTERNVSRRHCSLHRINGSFLVRDHGSYNGVVINGTRIEGEASVRPGDQIRIGDYTMLLEAEGAATSVPPTSPLPPRPSDPSLAKTPAQGAPASIPPAPIKAKPAVSRLVVLTAPLAGAEFALPERGQARLGRSEDMEITVDHRSVSREHVRLTSEAGRVRAEDCGSANGVLINGERVSERELLPGDVLELGEVLLRYVAPGESYVFDPSEARRIVAARGRRSRHAVMFAIGIIAVTAVVAAFIAFDEPEPSELSEPPAAAATPGAVSASDADEQRFAELLGACREAVSGGRFAEGMAHAQASLNLRPGAAEAAQCHATARAEHEQEQAFVRGKAAFEGGDLDAAETELGALSAHSALAARPDVLSVLSSFGEARLAEAELLVARNPERAGSISRALSALALLPEQVRDRARALMAQVASAPAKVERRAESKPDSKPASKPGSGSLLPRARPRASEPSPAPAAAEVEHRSPMEIASACLARGDNACVVRALSGKAQTAQELGLLIETHRAMGNVTQAQRSMASYVQRFPTARRAEAYRQMLERQVP